MGHSGSRTIILLITVATLSVNSLSSLLFHKLPEDPYHLARSFSWYLHFANLISIFGLVGVWRNHAPFLAIFANYLLLDTILFSIPRFLALGILHQLSSSICSTSSPLALPYPSPSSTPDRLTLTQEIEATTITTSSSLLSLETEWSEWTESWKPEECTQIVWLVQLTLVAGAVAATLLQVVGALYVKEFTGGLWRKKGLKRENEGWRIRVKFLDEEQVNDGRVKC